MISEVHDGLEYKRLEVHMLLEIQYVTYGQATIKSKMCGPGPWDHWQEIELFNDRAVRSLLIIL